jgi:hypothetical protein
MSWWERNQTSDPPAPQLIEETREKKPVLFDAKGMPLTWAERRVGFRPPSERKR